MSGRSHRATARTANITTTEARPVIPAAATAVAGSVAPDASRNRSTPLRSTSVHPRLPLAATYAVSTSHGQW
ncbi:hypothetical protein [Streptomyces sp. NPDC059489]|uniref:hypothetical protein n=1 Tax=Streptomyces sp. NPDC059489 TaxID=3346849 RepID=UPI00368B702A